MPFIICLAGAVIGVIVAKVSSWLVLPMVLKAQEEALRDRRFRPPIPAVLGDARRLRALTIAIYRYCIPLVFASVGAMAAYYLFIADAR